MILKHFYTKLNNFSHFYVIIIVKVGSNNFHIRKDND